MNNYSVLISLYFKESPLHLREALDSIFSQTCRSNDVVLVEDGTLGEELELVVREYENKYPELHVVRFEKNRGLGFALNDGILECKNEIVARMDTDDIAKPERMDSHINLHQLFCYSYTHRAACTFYHAHSALDCSSVQVRHLCLSDFLYLSFCDCSNLCFVRHT